MLQPYDDDKVSTANVDRATRLFFEEFQYKGKLLLFESIKNKICPA